MEMQDILVNLSNKIGNSKNTLRLINKLLSDGVSELTIGLGTYEKLYWHNFDKDVQLGIVNCLTQYLNSIIPEIQSKIDKLENPLEIAMIVKQMQEN